MTKWIRWALALGLCLALAVCGAMAAEADSGITVQLDGQPLTFTDAVPQVRNQRTYLPFRAVFEAMGAEVSYEGNVITAVRGDRVLTMTIGSTEYTVADKGVAQSLQMDVAPYVDTATWRTYVPVRFAAQAFGCVVGWDQARSTAIIIDAEKLAEEAKAGKSFTYLEQIDNLGGQYAHGLWNVTVTFDGDASMLGASVLTMGGAAKGVMADSSQVDMTMHMQLDMDGLIAIVSPLGGQRLTAEDQAMLDALKTDGADVAIRGDITTGTLYMNMDMGALGTKAGVEADAWYEMDMATLTKQTGISWTDLMSQNQDSSLLNTMLTYLRGTEPTDSTTAYTDFQSDADALFAAFADQGFESKDGAYVAKYTTPDGNMALALTLTMDGDQAAAYAMDMTVNNATITEDGASASITTSTSMTSGGGMKVNIGVNGNGLFTMNLVMDGSFTPGTTAPVVAPPAGAKLLPFTNLTSQNEVAA